MDQLVNLLKLIETSVDIPATKHLPYTHSLVQQASYLGSELLITPYSHYIPENMRELEARGYPVRCVERGERGWLLGGIHTSKGIIVFG